MWVYIYHFIIWFFIDEMSTHIVNFQKYTFFESFLNDSKWFNLYFFFADPYTIFVLKKYKKVYCILQWNEPAWTFVKNRYFWQSQGSKKSISERKKYFCNIISCIEKHICRLLYTSHNVLKIYKTMVYRQIVAFRTICQRKKMNPKKVVLLIVSY